MEKNKFDLEKIVAYISFTIAFTTLIFYVYDMQERISKIEVKVEKLEEKNNNKI